MPSKTFSCKEVLIMLNTKLFNVRLYLEGLKRLKVIGMAVAILSVTISALIPLVQWMDTPSDYDRIDLVEQYQLCLPLYAVIFLAPFFFLVLFSFLHKRKESDFFHAIPYTRTCVFLSFTAAALTFVFAIMIASAATAGIIWALNPFTTFHFGELVTMTLMCMLAAAQLSSVMILALTLTGTPTTTMLMFALFTLITRLVMFYLGNCLDSTLDIIHINDLPYFSFSWFLPFGMFWFAISGGSYYTDFNPFLYPTNVIYTLIVTVALFTAAWFFYKIRKSEMAGNTAPNRVAQHIFRILFTLPFVLLIPMVLIMEGGSEVTLIFVLVVISLLVYYLYELITTKRFKGFGKATALLPVLVVCCLLFTGAYYATQAVIFENSPDDPDEVVAITLDATTRADWDDYQAYLLEDSESRDRDLIKTVVYNMIKTVEMDKKDNYFAYDGGSWLKIDMKLKNGQTVTRRVFFRGLDRDIIRQKYVETIEIDETVFWSLPKENEVVNLWAEGISADLYTYVEFYDNYNEFYSILLREYDSLTVEQKDFVRSNDYYDKYNEDFFIYNIGLQWRRDDTRRAYYMNLMISEDMMPETYQYLKDKDHQRYLEEYSKES